jgi:hypothetical protein
LSYYPKPSSSGPSNNLFASGSAPANSDEYLIRADHNFNHSARMYFRYSYKKEFKTGAAQDWGSDPAGPGNERPNNRWGMAAGFSQIFNPTFTMNISSGVQIWHETSTNQSRGFDTTSLGLPSYKLLRIAVYPPPSAIDAHPFQHLSQASQAHHKAEFQFAEICTHFYSFSHSLP